jgi:F0F1-type ATP synthase assembly protein I
MTTLSLMLLIAVLLAILIRLNDGYLAKKFVQSSPLAVLMVILVSLIVGSVLRLYFNI